MPTSGPSKEELENYWKTSRQYFDELARYYKDADPQYYNEYIAPFYSNPLYSVSSGKQGSSGVRVVLLAVIAFVAIGFAGVVLFLVSTDKAEKFDNNKTYENSDEKYKKPDVNSEKDMFPSDEFLLGSKYLAQKDYDKAEEHFKKVQPDDKNYEEAQQMLESIKYLRKYDK